MARRARIEKQEPARPTRIVETHGSLTFDSYLCCGHRWSQVKDADDLNEFCQDCGATCRRDERARIVEYDRDADFLRQRQGTAKSPSKEERKVV